MTTKFTTDKSLIHISTFPILCAFFFMFVGLFFWFKSGDPSIVFDSACTGAFVGTILYTVSFLRYRNITYEITDKQIIKKRGDTVIRSVKLSGVESFYFKKNGKYPILKLKKDKELGFEMTLGHNEEIVATLKKKGIKEWTRK